jgi:tyrosyl-tRNA synthetase
MPRYEELLIERSQRYGGDVVLKKPEDLKTLYQSGKLHPTDLKSNAIGYLKGTLRPVREQFEKHPEILIEAFPDGY